MIRFVVDSTATPTREFASEHNLTVVPLRAVSYTHLTLPTKA